MDPSTLQQLRQEAEQHGSSLGSLLAKAAGLLQEGNADEALGLYRAGRRELQAFHDKWDTDVQSDDPSFADWWRQRVAEKEASILMAEGLALRWVGRFDDASASLERALALAPASTPEHALLLHGVGGIRHQQKAFAEAEELCRRAHAEYAELAVGMAAVDADVALQYWSQAARASADAAQAALGRGDYAGFDKNYADAIACAEGHDLPELGDRLWLQQAGYLLGFDATGETVQRVDLERKARSKRSTDPEFRFDALQMIAEYWSERGAPKRARSKLEEALTVVPPHRKWALLRQLADLAETLGDSQAALGYARDALAAARQLAVPGAVAAALRALVALHAIDDPDEADVHLAELRSMGDADEIKNALVARAIVHCRAKRFERASQDLDEAERAVPEDPGVLLARVAVLRGMDAKEEALRATEKAASAFWEQIRQGGGDWRSGFESLAALQESAAFLAAELGRTVEAFEWAEKGKALRLRSRFMAATEEEPNPPRVAFSDLRARLGEESAKLVYFCVTSRGTLALLCDPDFDEPRSFFLDLTDQALSRLLPGDQQGDMLWNTAVFDALAPLSEALGPCLREAISGDDAGTLYIVPDSQLYFVPFSAVEIDGGARVIDRRAVAYLPCAAMLLSRQPAEVKARTCLAAGAGEVQGVSLSEQAMQIAALPWDRRECMKEATAQEFLAKAPNFDVLHLQCHGRMDSSLPGTRSASFLDLAGGRLSAQDVYGASLAAELVFLNACVSGRFQSRLSSEVGGFWEAFLHAGARRIIVTLAYVDPGPAQLLALGFYRHWLGGKGSGEALRQAQLEVRRQRPEPCHWATHIVIG